MSTNPGLNFVDASLTVTETMLHVVKYLASSIPSGHDSSRPICAVVPKLEAIVDEMRKQAQVAIHKMESEVAEHAPSQVPAPVVTPPAPVVPIPEVPVAKAPSVVEPTKPVAPVSPK